MKQITAIIMVTLILGMTLLLGITLEEKFVIREQIPFNKLQWVHNKPSDINSNGITIYSDDFIRSYYGIYLPEPLSANVSGLNYQRIMGFGIKFETFFSSINRTVHHGIYEYNITSGANIDFTPYTNETKVDYGFKSGWHVIDTYNYTTKKNYVMYMLNIKIGKNKGCLWTYFKTWNISSNMITIDDKGMAEPYKIKPTLDILMLKDLKPPMFAEWESFKKDTVELSIQPIVYFNTNKNVSATEVVYSPHIAVLHISGIWVYLSIYSNREYWKMVWVYSVLIAVVVVFIGYLILRKISNRNI